MENKDRPAFPLDGNSSGLPDSMGLSKREKISATLLSGMLSNPSIIENLTEPDRDWIIEKAILLTDGLLAKLDEK